MAKTLGVTDNFYKPRNGLCKSRGNMVRAEDWGNGKDCSLFAFENAANGCLNSPVLNPKLSGELRELVSRPIKD